MPERLYSAYQVADLLGESPRVVSDWIERGLLACQRAADGPVQISERGLVSFLRRRGIDIETIMAGAALREGDPSQESQEGPVEAPPLPGVPDAIADPAAQVAQAILYDAVARGASDIHLEPRRDGLALRLRIDGVLHDKVNFKLRLPKTLAPRLIGHFKSLAGRDLLETSRPQEGRFALPVAGREMQFVLSTYPMRQGEKVVIGVLDRDAAVPGLSQLGLAERDEAVLRRALAQPCGMVLVLGPPRSGVAGTLRAMLAELNGPGRSAIAIDGDCDHEVEGVSQAQAGCPGELSVLEALRGAARQDVDVVMIGQVRDPATAAAAVEAASAGAMVLAGMHSRGIHAVPDLLLGMGLEPYALSAALLAAVAQRTVRRICPHCKEQVQRPLGLLDCLSLGRQEAAFPIFSGRGCRRCSNSGYSGSVGIFSVMEADEALAGLLRRQAGAGALEAAARDRGMKTICQDGAEKVRAGITSPEEVARVLATASYPMASGCVASRPSAPPAVAIGA